MGIEWIIGFLIIVLCASMNKYMESEEEHNPLELDESQEIVKRRWRIASFTLGVACLIGLLIVALMHLSWWTPLYILGVAYGMLLWWHSQHETYERAKDSAMACLVVGGLLAIVLGIVITVILLVAFYA